MSLPFDYYWYQATDRQRHAYRGKRQPAGPGARSICDCEVQFSTEPYSQFFPSCVTCWALIKELRGDHWAPGILTRRPGRPSRE